MTIKELKKNEFFTLKPIEYPKENQVYIKTGYDRSSKKYECVKFSDCNSFRLLKADTEIYTDFIF